MARHDSQPTWHVAAIAMALAIASYCVAFPHPVPSDPAFDNGPVITRALSDGNCRLESRDYWVSTPIVWPNRHGGALTSAGGYSYAPERPGIDIARLRWNGPKDQPMLIYRGQGGYIQSVTFDCRGIAGFGIFVEAHGGRDNRHAIPSGGMVTMQVAIRSATVAGFYCSDQPDANHADQMKHFTLLVYGCPVAYMVDCNQSVPHTLFAADFRGCQTGYRFERGGGLHVYGQYFGSSQENPTLLYVGKSTSNNGTYDIQGLQVDATTKNLTLVNHGRYAQRVRVSGNVAGGATLAGEAGVVNRNERPDKPQYHDVRIDCFGVPEGDE